MTWLLWIPSFHPRSSWHLLWALCPFSSSRLWSNQRYTSGRNITIKILLGFGWYHQIRSQIARKPELRSKTNHWRMMWQRRGQKKFLEHELWFSSLWAKTLTTISGGQDHLWFPWGFIFKSSGGVTVWKLLCSWKAAWVVVCSSQWEGQLLGWPWWANAQGAWTSFFVDGGHKCVEEKKRGNVPS